jgi:hypothetical protein
MPELRYLEDKYLILPRAFLNEVVTVLSELPDFDEELSLVSSYYGSAAPHGNNMVIVNVIFRDILKETMVRLCREEFEEYTGLKEAYTEANLMRDLVIETSKQKTRETGRIHQC